MKKTPKVTIVIPCYNYSKYIGQTLDCLISQSLTEWEAIVVDDGSTDNSATVIENYSKKDSRIKYIYQDNQGLSGARNTGIANSTGEYITFLDADDLLSPEKLSIQVKFMDNEQACTVSYTDAKYFKDGEPDKLFSGYSLDHTEWMARCSGDLIDILPVFVTTIMPVNSPLIRSIFLKDRHIFFDTSYKSYEDWEFWLRCLHLGAQYTYLNNPLARALIRVHPTSMRNKNETMLVYELRLRKQMDGYLKVYKTIGQNKALQKNNNRQSDHASRKLIRSNNRFNTSGIKHVINERGLIRALTLLIKELNASMRGH